MLVSPKRMSNLDNKRRVVCMPPYLATKPVPATAFHCLCSDLHHYDTTFKKAIVALSCSNVEPR